MPIWRALSIHIFCPIFCSKIRFFSEVFLPVKISACDVILIPINALDGAKFLQMSFIFLMNVAPMTILNNLLLCCFFKRLIRVFYADLETSVVCPILCSILITNMMLVRIRILHFFPIVFTIPPGEFYSGPALTARCRTAPADFESPRKRHCGPKLGGRRAPDRPCCRLFHLFRQRAP